MRVFEAFDFIPKGINLFFAKSFYRFQIWAQVGPPVDRPRRPALILYADFIWMPAAPRPSSVRQAARPV